MKAPIRNIENEDTKISCILRALLGLHTLSNCDTLSASSCKGKIKAFHLFCKMEVLFSCFNPLENIKLLCYKIYFSKRGKSDCDQLPPCRSLLQKRTQRAKYQKKKNLNVMYIFTKRRKRFLKQVILTCMLLLKTAIERYFTKIEVLLKTFL